ncbi:MAG TPA: ABC transporter substrate-binding protein [Thermoleophilaceae bacterium]|nr:ABC transporter substrate-binding protein [Thermoleophilaceae bacterium]
MHFFILGPLEIWADGVPVPLGGPKQRALLAMLLLNANRVVSRSRLIDELWRDGSAVSVQHALDVQVSRLRHALGCAEDGTAILVTRTPGYVLRVKPGRLDLDRFEQLVADGQAALGAGDPAAAAERLRAAERLWRGRPLADLEDEPLARGEVERLEELRLGAAEDRIEAELALGRHNAVVPELESLVRDHPLRERPRAQLMLALYRSGRQADALEIYRDARRLLLEQLGLEPSAQLRELQRAILQQHAALDHPRHEAVRVAARAPTPASAPRHPRSRPLALVLVAVTASALLGLVVSGSSGRHVRAPKGDAVALIDSAGELKAVVGLRSSPTKLAGGFGSLWVSHAENGTVSRVDPEHGARDTITVGRSPGALAVAGGAVWVANSLDGTLSRIDPANGEVTQTVAVGRLPGALAAGAGALWVANRGDNTVARVNWRSGRVEAKIPTGRAPSGVAVADRTVWVSNEESGSVTRIDPRTNAVTQTIEIGSAPSAVAVAGRAVWVLDRLDATISQLDADRDVVTETRAIRGTPSDLAVVGDAVWVADEASGTVARVGSPRTVSVGDRAAALAATPAGLWTGVSAGGPNHRGGTLRVVASSELDSLDPAFATGALMQPLAALYDGLVAFNHVPGARGTQLVPDLALSLPTPGDGGLTYTFRLRRGIRFSTGAPVTARDVRSSFERLYALRSPHAAVYDAIKGVAACRRHPRRCDLSRSIVADDHAGTVTFHLDAPDPDFLFKLALTHAAVLPASAPARRAAGALGPARGVPASLASIGPYMVGRYRAGRVLTLVRNPHFREWSPAAQPDGYPDKIVVTLGSRPSDGASLVQRGAADFMPNFGAPPRERRAALRTRFGSRLRVNALPVTNFFFLNTRVRPFDDIRVRRAVNYALDRSRIVMLHGGREAAQATCQLLPPLIPGHRTYCPYTRARRADGRWRRPDLARARRLVDASGTSGMRIQLWATATPEALYDEARVAVAMLRRLGYRASVRVLRDSRFFDVTNDSRSRAQIISGGWSVDYPAASSIFVKLTCAHLVPASPVNPNASQFCDPAIDALVMRASALQASHYEAANALWARIDRKLTDEAIWLPTVTPTQTDILSRRTGNYRYHLMYGALIDQLWVR